MNYEKKFKDFLDRIQGLLDNAKKQGHIIIRVEDLENAFPELQESENERIRKWLIDTIKQVPNDSIEWETIDKSSVLAWLEKQKEKIQVNDFYTEFQESENERIRKELLEHCKNQAKPYIYTGNKCPQIQSWIAWLEKQDQVKEYTFKSIPRLLEMIEPTDRAKAYCQKLIDTLINEGYAVDAKIVCKCLKKMCGEKVALATMDEKQDQVKEDDNSLTIDDKINNKIIEHIIEALQRYMPKNDFLLYEKLEMISWLENQRKQKPYGQRKECFNCQFNYAGHCKGYCELKRQDKSTFEKCKQESGRVFKNSDGTHFNLSQLERVAKAETPEESLGISSEKHNEIVNECIFGDDEKNSTQSEEQEPTDKPKSKFNVGDWITDGLLTCKVLSVMSKSYELHLYNDDYCHFRADVRSVDKHYHLWTINDAKPGDILVASDDSLFMFADVKDNSVYYHFALSKDGTKLVSDGQHAWETANSCHPATKEQCDTLKKAMTDAGYKWDKEKKKLILFKEENSNDSDLDLEWSNMETKECHCYSCELYDWKNNNCRNYKLCKNPKNTYKGFYKKVQKKMKNEEDKKEIRNKIAHEIAWESTKHYDPTLSKENWCEMAAREAIDRIGGGGENPVNYKQGYKDAIKDACRWLNNRYRDYGYLDLEDVTSMILELDK